VSTLQPVSVALKLGFLGVLYLFLLWVAWSATRDLRAPRSVSGAGEDGTGMYSASAGGVVGPPAPPRGGGRAPRLVVERAPGHAAGMIYDIDTGAVLGRGDAAEIRLNDPFASSRHARIVLQGGVVMLEDLGSTNGTYLNEELLAGVAPLHHGDRVRIGDSEFTYEDG
jgi:hypothetical protein